MHIHLDILFIQFLSTGYTVLTALFELLHYRTDSNLTPLSQPDLNSTLMRQPSTSAFVPKVDYMEAMQEPANIQITNSQKENPYFRDLSPLTPSEPESSKPVMPSKISAKTATKRRATKSSNDDVEQKLLKILDAPDAHDEDEAYLLALAPSLRSLSKLRKLRVKREITNIVMNAEEVEISEQTNKNYDGSYMSLLLE